MFNPEKSTETRQETENSSVSTYTGAVTAYLDGAEWLTVLDAPLKVHALAIARSLDRQLAEKGEVQSALAGSFDKVMLRLDQRRPGPARDPDPLHANGPHGEASIFQLLEED